MYLKGKTYYTELSRRSGLSAALISRIARGLEDDPAFSVIKILANKGFGISWKLLLAPVDDDVPFTNPYLTGQHTTKLPNGNGLIRNTTEVYPSGNP
ncbi:MAG: helix-turn-helix transcriptional regulator [Gammaproteobacteria bacterium]|nr:helix-turn-helix transcriptional regulator [Gammaproteobacteria bacterium]